MAIRIMPDPMWTACQLNPHASRVNAWMWRQGLGAIRAVCPVKALRAWCEQVAAHLMPLTVEQKFAIDQLAQKRQEEQNRQKAIRLANSSKGPRSSGVFVLGAIQSADPFPEHVLAWNDNGWLILHPRLLNRHMIMIGASGAGKTEALKRLLSALLDIDNDADIFVVDGKGSRQFALDVVNMIASARGVSVPLFRLDSEECDSVYNCFVGTKRAIYERLAAMIGVKDSTGNATYYADVNRNLLQLICGVTHPELDAPRSFEALRARAAIGWLKDAYGHDAIELEFIDKLHKDLISGLRNRISHLVRNFDAVVDADGFAIDDVGAAVFSLDGLASEDATQAFVGLLLGDIKDWVSNRKDRSRQAYLVIDEFGQLNSSEINSLLTQARENNVGIVLVSQDMNFSNDLIKHKILSNTAVKVAMANDAADDLILSVGTRPTLHATMQSRADLRTDGLHEVITGMGSYRPEMEMRINPDQLGQLQPGEAFVAVSRHVARVYVPMVGAVTHADHAIAVYRKNQAESYAEWGETVSEGIGEV